MIWKIVLLIMTTVLMLQCARMAISINDPFSPIFAISIMCTISMFIFEIWIISTLIEKHKSQTKSEVQE